MTQHLALRSPAHASYGERVGAYDPGEFLDDGLQAQLLRGMLTGLNHYVGCVDRQRRVLYLNRTLSRELPELLGKPFDDFIVPDQRDAVVACFERAFESGQRQTVAYDAVTSTGHPVHVRTDVLPLRDANGRETALFITHDETERRELTLELERSEEFRRRVIENLPDFVSMLDRKRRFIWVNRLAPGLTWDDVIGTKIETFLAPESVQPTCETIDRVFETGSAGQCETEGYGSETTMRWVLNRVVPLEVDGKVDSALLITSDISELKRAEQALRDKEKQLYHAQRLESIGQLAGGIAHDFNNLLQVIDGNLYFIREGLGLGQDVSEELEQALRATRSAADLTSRLLAVGRRKRVDPTRVDLGALAGASMRMLRAAIPENVNIAFEPPTESFFVEVDAPQFEQVLINLCVNARDAMPNGGTLRVWLEAGDRGDIVLSVADDGVGIPRENLTRVFEPFYTTKGTGSGLGLAVAAGIIAAHGGTLSAESDGVRGTTMKVRLPRTDSASSDSRPALARPLGGTATVLVAEDEPRVRTQVVRMLRRAGYTVLEAENGARAVEVFRANSTAIDALVLDAIMPLCDGWQAYLQIERLKPGIKAVFTTGYAANVLPPDFMSRGARLLSKPFKADELLAKVRELLAPPAHATPD
ncbi:MAG TPA: ATP-binding protein [Polyangiaceae bacterium]|nr:ATP-binding protein [Polyangiaceae bacterium]